MNVKQVILLFWAVTLFSSCQSYLEELPQNKLKPTTTEDYEQLLNKAYISKQVMPYLDVLSDDIELIAANHVQPGPEPGDQYVSAYMWQNHHETSMNGGDQAFSRFYESIFYTNAVLDGIDNALGVELNEANVQRTKGQVKGEAHVVRAYSYFYLVNLYAPPYVAADAANLSGVPINLSTSAEDKTYTRSSLSEVYTLIEKDLLEGIKLLEANPAKVSSKFKFNSSSAKALLARVYLYMERWDDAILYAKEVLQANSTLFNLYDAGEKLNSNNNSGTAWNNTVIYGTDYMAISNSNVLFANGLNELMPIMAYWPFITSFSVNTALADTYEVNDVRRFYFMHTYSRDTYAGLRVKLTYAKNRFKDLTHVFSATSGSGYTRVIRTEEMYLILAEAYAHKNDGGDNAIQYLNTLREQKFREGRYTMLQAKDFSPSELLDYVFLERRRELCFEGHRWFDLRRHGMPAQQRMGYDNQTATLKVGDPRYTLQIPQRELSVNPGIGSNPR